MSFVYAVTNVTDGKVYIGCTKGTIERRWARHLSKARQGADTALARAIRKHGPLSFTIEPVEEICGSHLELMEAEKRHIALRDCLAPKGYNLTRGGDGVDFLLPEVREKHRASMVKLYSDPKWLSALTAGARKRSASAEWQANQAEGARKRLSDPAWIENHKQGIARVFLDSAYRSAHIQGVRKRSARPEWRAAQKAGAQKRICDPAWQTANAKNLDKAHAAISANAVARDASLPERERARRARRRELDRLRKAARRAAARKAA